MSPKRKIMGLTRTRPYWAQPDTNVSCPKEAFRGISLPLTDSLCAPYSSSLCIYGIMALSSTFWRLNLLSKPSVSHIQTTLRALKPFKPKLSHMCSLPISSSLNSSNFSTPKNPTFLEPQTRTPYPQDDLIVLGIETSCDDTAAAVVCY